MLVSGTTLIILTTFFIYNDIKIFKKSLLDKLSILASVVGSNVRVALYFEDNEAATKVLSLLMEDSQIEFTGLYDSKGKIFAKYQSAGFSRDKYRSSGNKKNYIELKKQILLKGAFIGSILIIANLNEFREKQRKYFQLVGIILLATIGLVIWLSIKLQRIISKPILNLANTANKISNTNNYSLRVNYPHVDELGQLYNCFNEMIAQIDKREIQLNDYRKHLEHKVQKRTKELSLINSQLSIEVERRKNFEDHLKNSLDEKEILLKEIHHRVKNNLQIISSLLNIQAQYKGPEYSHIFSDCSNRIQSIALLHENIYKTSKYMQINFDQYIENLVKYLFQTFGISSEAVKVNIQVSNIPLDLDAVLPCGLIVQELISNSLKHAFPDGKGEIDICMQYIIEGENNIELNVSDNGVGLPEKFDLEEVDTLGLKLVSRLVENQLKGTIFINLEEKTEFKIKFMSRKENNVF